MDLGGAFRRVLGLKSKGPATAEPTIKPGADDVTLASVLTALRASRDHARESLARNPQRRRVERSVDDRVLILAIDELYRTGIKRHEHNELRSAARALARQAGVQPYDGEVEGRYGSDSLLEEYFRTVRALQRVDEQERPRVAHMPEFARLNAVLSSPLFGSMHRTGVLLPRGMDPLAVALRSASEWTLAELVRLAHDVAQKHDDCSLLGMASAASDPVSMVALLDPTVLYFEESTFGNPPIPLYQWVVSPDIARRAERFVTTYTTLFKEEFPLPTAENAELFGAVYYDRAGFVGRCVSLGPKQSGRGYYHWAIYMELDGSPRVHEFWADDHWTTTQYRAALPPSRKGPADVRRAVTRR
jgi:hypothetical protein